MSIGVMIELFDIRVVVVVPRTPPAAAAAMVFAVPGALVTPFFFVRRWLEKPLDSRSTACSALCVAPASSLLISSSCEPIAPIASYDAFRLAVRRPCCICCV